MTERQPSREAIRLYVLFCVAIRVCIVMVALSLFFGWPMLLCGVAAFAVSFIVSLMLRNIELREAQLP